MSHFYGTVEGIGKTVGTRRGSTQSGLTTHAASWRGAIRVRVFRDDSGQDRFAVEQVPWQGQGKYRLLAIGVLGEIPENARR